MGNVETDYGVDETLHLADGSHRSDPPAGLTERAEMWVSRRDKHIATHVAEAMKANADLRAVDELLLRDLANKAAQQHQGRIYLLARTFPGPVPLYQFKGLDYDGRMNREDSIRALLKALREPRQGL